MAKRHTAPVVTGELPFQPVGSGGGESKLPFIEGRDCKFYFAFPPKSWEVCKARDSNEWDLLPVPKTIEIRPGANLVEAAKVKGQEPNAARTRGMLEDQGVVVLRAEIDTYCGKVDSANGPRYFSRWERVTTYPDGDWEMRFDGAGFDAWRRELVEEGKVPPPRESVAQGLRTRLQRRIARAEMAQHLPKAQRQIEEAKAALAGLEAALAKMRGE